MSYRDQLRPILATDEGVKNKPYRDTVGKLSIGIGRSLEDVGISSDEIALMLDNDINRAEAGARRLVRDFDGLTDARKCVVVSMVFNIGEAKVKTFTITLGCINAGQWQAAALGMRSSLWQSK